MKPTTHTQFVVEPHKLSYAHEAIYFHHLQTHEAVLAINEDGTPSERLIDIANGLHTDCLDGWGIASQGQVAIYPILKK